MKMVDGGYYRCSEGMVYRLEILDADCVVLHHVGFGRSQEGTTGDFHEVADDEKFEYLGTVKPE